MKRIGIVAALPGELKPLVHGWQAHARNVWAGHLAGFEAVAIAGGIGADAATRASELLVNDFQVNLLVSYGWAGSLTCAVKPPNGCVISEVVDAVTGERFASATADGFRLITLDHVARADEKRGLAQRHQSVLVDMEAAAVGRVAARHGVTFCCFKGVSDGYTDRLPDFNRFMDASGEMRMAKLIGYAIVHPQYWGALARLGRNSSAAAKELVGVASEGLKHLA